MPDEVKDPVQPPSPAEVAAAAKAAEEERLKNQIPFDPKVHGVGTTPVNRPTSVKELFDYVQKIEARVSALESKPVRGQRAQ
jgi:hypothetical protein